MNKSTFFTGQPIFSQLLSYIPKSLVFTIANKHSSDYYTKRYGTYEHLVTMLYSIYNNCTSIREVVTGLLAWEERIVHLGMDYHPRRSTISDANLRRDQAVFESLYFGLLKRYEHFLSDSPKRNARFFIFDSTTITLFQEILKGSGLPKLDGRKKGGIKVHTLIDSLQNVPCMIRFSNGVANDVQYLKFVDVPKGSIVVFDRGYPDYRTYNRFSEEKITWVTRLRVRTVFEIEAERPINDQNKRKGIIGDFEITLGHSHRNSAIKVKARLIKYIDPKTKKIFEFLTNDFERSAYTITQYYRKRWKIELLFKQLKQNFPLRTFLGDNENAIKIQIWITLIANLIVQVIKNRSKSKLSFSNIVAMIRVHLSTYIHLYKFIRNPEKSLRENEKVSIKKTIQHELFDT